MNDQEDSAKNVKPSQSFLQYQVFRDLAMVSDPPDILLYYEELIKQFGYIVLFSGIFPLASLMSYLSNGIQIRSQMSNLTYQRRFKADVSNGIGNWMGCLENLSQLSIIVNCMMIYFTSTTYKEMFVEESVSLQVETQELMTFFMTVIFMEYVLRFLKQFIENMIDDVPEEVQRGERERNDLISNFKRAKEVDEVTCRIKNAFDNIKNSKIRLGSWNPVKLP